VNWLLVFCGSIFVLIFACGCWQGGVCSRVCKFRLLQVIAREFDESNAGDMIEVDIMEELKIRREDNSKDPEPLEQKDSEGSKDGQTPDAPHQTLSPIKRTPPAKPMSDYSEDSDPGEPQDEKI
jgi:hypothetical protein